MMTRCMLVGLLLCISSTPVWASRAIQLEYLGHADVATGTTYRGTAVGGLSGIDYDPTTRTYFAISDDGGQNGPVRFYGLTIDLSDGVLDSGDIQFTDVTSITNGAGQPIGEDRADPESIRTVAFPGLLYWTDERVSSDDPTPSVRAMTRDGTPVAEFDIPRVFETEPNHGIRNNLAFESLAYDADRDIWVTAVENALIQDGPEATLDHGSPVRVLTLDADTGEPRRQYIYVTEPIPNAPASVDGSANNGLSELLAYDSNTFMALERAYAAGVGNTIRLFLTTTRGATDVSRLDSIRGHRIRPMRKRLLLDLGQHGLSLDNIEGMTFGPTINGDRTLILVADNNFSTNQRTQFLAYRIHDDRHRYRRRWPGDWHRFDQR